MKRFFLSRSLRERSLLLLFFCAAGIVWLFSAAERLSGQMANHRQAVIEAASQKLWLDSKADIEGRAARAAALVECVAHSDDPVLEGVNVGHRTRVDPHAEERQVDDPQGRHTVLEQAEHYPAQR